MSNGVSIQVIMELLSLVAQYGVPAVQNIMATWGKDSVTLEDIQDLKSKIKHPSAYEATSQLPRPEGRGLKKPLVD